MMVTLTSAQLRTISERIASDDYYTIDNLFIEQEDILSRTVKVTGLAHDPDSSERAAVIFRMTLDDSGNEVFCEHEYFDGACMHCGLVPPDCWPDRVEYVDGE